MIDTQDSTARTADEVSATARLAIVHVRYGELVVPPRILDQLTDGPVRVTILHDGTEAACDATLTGGSKITGITWPADVKPGTKVTVMCPRGGGNIRVLLPLPDPITLDLRTAVLEETPVEDREGAPLTELDEAVLAAELKIPEPAGETVAEPGQDAAWPDDAALAAGENTEVFTSILAAVDEPEPELLSGHAEPADEEPFGLYADDEEPREKLPRWVVIARACVVTAAVAIVATSGFWWAVTR